MEKKMRGPSRHSQAVAFFDLNCRSVPLHRVHQMVNDVERRIGQQRCGLIEFTYPADSGRYLIIFYSREAADLFQTLYTQTCQPFRRTPRLPDDVVLVAFEDALLAAMMHDLHVFLHQMTDPRRAAAPWN